MTEPLELSDRRAQSIREVMADKGPFAFVGVTPAEKLEGINGALGIATANERGYSPVPVSWARYLTLTAAMDHAEKLNADLGLSADEAFAITASTMGGRRYYAPAE